MPSLTPGQIIDALARNEPNRVIGVEETEQVDFKLAPYLLAEDRQKWELAKDVAAFGNRRGGVIVVGVESERRSNEIIEVAKAIRRVRKERVDLPQHRSVIDAWIYPRLEGVDIRWYPPASGAESGILVIEVPAQQEDVGPFIVRGMRDPHADFKGAVGIPRRDRERIVWDTAQDLHRRIRSAQAVSLASPTSGAGIDRATARLTESERYQGWEAEAVYFLQAIPPPGPDTLAGFYDEVREGLVNHPVLRHSGFARRWRHRAEALEGGWITRTDDGLTWVEPDGLLTQGLVVSEDSPLGWYYNQNRTEGAPLVLHPVALVETTLEFFRLLYLLIKPRARTGPWQYRLWCRRFRSHLVTLGQQEAGFPIIIGSGMPASSDEWDRPFDDTGSPNRDAFEALQRFYALFGQAPASIPLTDGGAVSEEQLMALHR